MRRLVDITRWPALLILAFAGAMLVVFAFATVGLFTTTRANLRFLAEFGWRAVSEGGLWQLAGLIGLGLVALACFMAYKICESELIGRYFTWVGRDQARRK